MLSTTRAQGCWLRMWCCSHPPLAALPTVPGCAKPRHHPRALHSSLAANAPRAASSPYPRLLGSHVPLAGAPLGLLFLTIV